MSQRKSFRRVGLGVAAVGLLGATSVGCLDRPVSAPETRLQSGVQLPVVNNAVDSVDILFEIDNSNSMRDNQAQLARQFEVLISQLVSPPDRNMDGLPDYPPVRSLHVGVISSDLGTPGSVVPSCANSDSGDDGLLNPIRNGQAIRTHQPWTTAPPGIRPMRCMNNPQQYPNFLTFDAMSTNAAEFREDFVCNAFLSTGGCGLEQQLESAYRALVIRNPRAQPGNTDPNAGFVRDNAVLAIVLVSDEEDGSVRDCRYQEGGDPDGDCRPPRGDALSVFDSANGDWAATDLNLRLYMYTPGSPQDPTWNLNRYIDPMRPTRGFTSLKPGRPDQVIFAGILGVPINIPTRPGGTNIDWTALLGNNPDGSEGFTGMSPEGPVSMRQRNMDPSCGMRVTPACRREGSSYDPSRPPCDTTAQYFAWPSRRIAEVARRFAERYDNGTVSSICRSDYGQALQQIVQRIQQRLTGRCLPRQLQTTPPLCNAMNQPSGCVRMGDPTPVRVNCVVRETLPEGMTAAQQCTSARGRRPAGRDPETNREQCLVDQVSVPVGGMPSGSAQGFYYDTTVDPTAPDCRQRISFTSNAELATGATALIDCVQNVGATN
jgi:hypothetical protein